MSKSGKKADANQKTLIIPEAIPGECPFREFRDSELGIDYWGLNPATFRAMLVSKSASKPPADFIWSDDQTQPLPKSARHYLHGWMRAEELAMSRWDAEVVLFEENNGGRMSVMDIQLSHAQVLMRSSFSRRVLSTCFILERVEGPPIEHLSENFAFTYGPEGWRARYHIYSPGMKAGGGPQHRPQLSKNGCYLVRLYYLGAWRSIWVSDQVPVDATDSPLLPFSPLLSHVAPTKAKQIPTLVTSSVVHLWPLLICKALLKIAAPDMNSDEELDIVEDELLEEFDIMHALTGCLSLKLYIPNSLDLWQRLIADVQVFSWDDDDETVASTVKSKSTKKVSNKEHMATKRAILTLDIMETKEYPPYALPGITPALELTLLVSMARDVPLKKPLPEPEVALWKHYRWIDWARSHGLYEAYDCPRTKFLKVNSLMKLSHAPHLLDIQSTESITHCFREEQTERQQTTKKKDQKDRSNITTMNASVIAQQKEELREWVQYDVLYELVKSVNLCYYPSFFNYTSTASNPSTKTAKIVHKAIDIPAPKSVPLYLQIDGPEENKLKLSLSIMHPRILFNAGAPIVDYLEPGYMILEMFEWFLDMEIPLPKAYLKTRCYDSTEISFLPGRHFCRLWVHSRTNWHVALISESTLILGTRDMIQSAAVKECPWASRFLNHLGSSFTNWIRINRSNTHLILHADREFYSSYQPDLYWDPEVIGYEKSQLHWMFRYALQSLLYKRLQPNDYHAVCGVLRRYLMDPDFGFPPKPIPGENLRDIVAADPCDCVMPEVEEFECMEEHLEEHDQVQEDSIKSPVSPDTMSQLLTRPKEPVTSQVCEVATEELPCGLLKQEREKVLRKHEAATLLQAHWRGHWARSCLTVHSIWSPEVIKLIMENAFGNLDALSALMNEFFQMYPGTKYAFSVASALSGVYGLCQYHGNSPVTIKCKWVPYFQGVFFCHYPVKVHFDIQSALHYSTVAVYDNDTGEQLPQAYNAHVTFDFKPNNFGYTVMGHGTVTPNTILHGDIHWQLTVLSSIDNVFHVCDNPETDLCAILPLPSSHKLHLEEIFIPNRRNILGGISIAVSRIEAVSFRATATEHELEMEAILRTTNPEGEVEEVARCKGIGEICWPYIRLKPPSCMLTKKKSMSHGSIPVATRDSLLGQQSARSLNKKSKIKAKSQTKIKEAAKPAPVEPKMYVIEVIATNGWSLPLEQWKRVDEVRNSLEPPKVEIQPKKPGKEKVGSAKDKKEEKEKEKPPPFTVHQPNVGDAYTELEISTAIGGGALAKRDDERDLAFANARRLWETKEPGRSMRGAQIRTDFRSEFLASLAIPEKKSELFEALEEEDFMPEVFGESPKSKQEVPVPQGPTPVTESISLEEIEAEEEAKYFLMPEQLRDKFVPLYFIPLCTKDNNEDDNVLVTPDIAEAGRKERQARIEGALERMRELQHFNETNVLWRQKRRCGLLEKLSVEAHWTPELAQVLEERDDAIAREALERTLSANRKKIEGKKDKK